MTLGLVVILFCSVLGILLILYTFNFRHRSLFMGPERLIAALSRTVSVEDEPGEEELREGLSELESRLRWSFYVTLALTSAILALCLVFVATSVLSQLSLALSGLCILLASILISIALLRDITRKMRTYLNESRSQAH